MVKSMTTTNLPTLIGKRWRYGTLRQNNLRPTKNLDIRSLFFKDFFLFPSLYELIQNFQQKSWSHEWPTSHIIEE